MNIHEMITAYQDNGIFDINEGFGWAFWVYTFTALLSILVMGFAFWKNRFRPKLGMGIGVTCLVIMVILIPLVGDWPPLLTYVITLVMGVGVGFKHYGR